MGENLNSLISYKLEMVIEAAQLSLEHIQKLRNNLWTEQYSQYVAGFGWFRRMIFGRELTFKEYKEEEEQNNYWNSPASHKWSWECDLNEILKIAKLAVKNGHTDILMSLEDLEIISCGLAKIKAKAE